MGLRLAVSGFGGRVSGMLRDPRRDNGWDLWDTWDLYRTRGQRGRLTANGKLPTANP